MVLELIALERLFHIFIFFQKSDGAICTRLDIENLSSQEIYVDFRAQFCCRQGKNTQAGCRPASIFHAVCSKICRKDTCIRL